ncbi:hypothetical protein TI39_contig4119g00002 [Zymoseptoria brevis]|uniref:ATPase domain-containing protein n=1 Tax=Zymoseptoria brevis TaxID=1047168 RepID=A0A0F4GD38_9PEZI|nr:hypothetical protein TI39_contig4119g00002 [Zymoseptoria brevis]
MFRFVQPSRVARQLVHSTSRHAGSILSPHHGRTFFGLGEIASVLTNPAQTLQQLNESKEMLQKAREENKLKNEKQRIPKTHTFQQLPGFHGRHEEQKLLRKVLDGNPQLNVVFGATSVGKTALLRQVLATDDFFVIKFDLRISGFADLRTLYFSLCEQFQSLFTEMAHEDMDKLSIAFKHLMLDMDEKELEHNYKVSVADIADLMETLQSCLLKYKEYDPQASYDEAMKAKQEEDSAAEKGAKVGSLASKAADKVLGRKKDAGKETETNDDDGDEPKLFRKRPICFLIDECHKLPALVSDTLSLKVFLDTLLVLTKQDRLCHVILSTSDAFFHHFLRWMNVGHHARIITIGDCTKQETLSYIQDEIMPTIPKHLEGKLNVEEMYEAFGGKLAHIGDFVQTWCSFSGDTTPYQSAIFTQAYTLLQFHLTHESFDTYSPLAEKSTWNSADNTKGQADFSREDLLKVMEKLVKPPYSLPYFDLCREIGTRQTDMMIKTRVLDLRWTKTVSPEQDWVERVWSEDGVERPIVKPMTTIVRRAMEVCLKEDNARADRRSDREAEDEKYKGEKSKEKYKEEKPQKERRSSKKD